MSQKLLNQIGNTNNMSFQQIDNDNEAVDDTLETLNETTDFNDADSTYMNDSVSKFCVSSL